MMNRRENTDSIPTDLILEIFSRLPSKSATRFRCLSKLWGSMLSRPYFTELFLTRSSARSRLLIVVKGYGEWLLYSSAQPRNSYEKSSLVVAAADFHTKFRGQLYREDLCRYGSGLIYFSNRQISKEVLSVICNPITGQYAILPELDDMGLYQNRYCHGFIGFDPIDKQFKIFLTVLIAYNDSVHHILTLGGGNMRWRKVQCPFTHHPLHERICINGVLYYLAQHSDERSIHVIVCFDVRSEKFKFIDLECSPYHYGDKLINYKGKLSGITWDFADNTFKLYMWVLENVEKQKWSKYVYTLPENEVVGDSCYLSVVGVTATGDIVLSTKNACKQLYVFYFNPERNTLLSVEIQGVLQGQEWFNNHRVYAIVDHVEDLNFNIIKT